VSSCTWRSVFSRGRGGTSLRLLSCEIQGLLKGTCRSRLSSALACGPASPIFFLHTASCPPPLPASPGLSFAAWLQLTLLEFLLRRRTDHLHPTDPSTLMTSPPLFIQLTPGVGTALTVACTTTAAGEEPLWRSSLFCSASPLTDHHVIGSAVLRNSLSVFLYCTPPAVCVKPWEVRQPSEQVSK